MAEGIITRRGFKKFNQFDPFNEGSLIDGWLFNGDYTGLRNNGATGVSNSSFTTGIDDQAVSFNGTNTDIQFPTKLVPEGNDARSVSFWAFLNSTSTDKRMLAYASGTHGSSDGAFDIEPNIYGSPGYWGVYFWPNNLTFLGASDVNYDVWEHICVTHSGGPAGSGTKLYRNGNYVGNLSGANIDFNTSSATTHEIGYRTYTSSSPLALDVAMDTLRLFSKELTAAEVKYLYDNGG